MDITTINQYKNNVQRGVWIPWDTYNSLKDGDTIERPHYAYGCDEPDGKEVIHISELFKSSRDGIEYGNFWGKATYINAKGKKRHYELGGVISINMQNIEIDIARIPADNVIKEIIKIALSNCGTIRTSAIPTDEEVEYIVNDVKKKLPMLI